MFAFVLVIHSVSLSNEWVNAQGVDIKRMLIMKGKHNKFIYGLSHHLKGVS